MLDAKSSGVSVSGHPLWVAGRRSVCASAVILLASFPSEVGTHAGRGFRCVVGGLELVEVDLYFPASSHCDDVAGAPGVVDVLRPCC